MGFATDSICTVAVAGHGSTGKTSLVEHLLFTGGAIPKAEAVESGKTVSDSSEEEIAAGQSIHLSLSNLVWKDKKINILDTPGASDFVGEVVASFRAAESSLVVVGARSGVEIETIKIWRRLEDRNMPRIAFVNKMDVERASFTNALNDLSEKFSTTFVPVSIPMGEAGDFQGVIDLVENKAYMAPAPGQREEPVDIPAEYTSMVEEYRATLMGYAAEGDDDLTEKFLEEETLTDDEIRLGLKEGLRDNKLVPVFCGSALRDSGLYPLLDFFATSAPTPAGIEETAYTPDEEEVAVKIDSSGLLAMLNFKTSIDQFSGKLSYIKVMSGKLTGNTEFINFRDGSKEKPSKIYTAMGKKLVEVDELPAGDVGILTKLDSAHTNDTFCVAERLIHYKPLQLPQPVYSLAIEALAKKDEDKLAEHLNRASEEDKTFRIEFNTETKQTVISGMGELHINTILDKIKTGQKIEVETHVPKVAYRETITKNSDSTYRHKKQSGGHGQFGEVAIRVKPLPRGEYYAFENEIKGGSVSKGYMPGIEKGFHEAMAAGTLAGYPVVDVGISIYDGKEHPVDSSEMAFKIAARGALHQAMEKAGPTLLEPIMNLSVFIDEQYLGDVLSDLSSRRGRVMGQEQIGGGIVEIKAQVPQAELLRYAIDLRSITSGTGSFEVEFDHYSAISGKIADDVIKASEAAKSETG